MGRLRFDQSLGRMGLVLAAFLIGCGPLACDSQQNSREAAAPPAATSKTASSTPIAATTDPAEPDDEHAHQHSAPHDGVLVELGDHESQLEFVLDPETGLLTVYVLDAHAESAVRLSEPQLSLQIERIGAGPPVRPGREALLDAVGNALTGETPGDSSVFSGVVAELAGATRFEAVLPIISVKGREYRNVRVRYPDRRE